MQACIKLGIPFTAIYTAEDKDSGHVLFAREHPDCIGQYNRFGGALAYGHPYGASGGILLAHLLKSLQAAGGGCGLLAIAGAGGMGEAILVEMIA